MTDNSAGSRLTLTTERNGDTLVVRCNGRLVAGVSNRFYLDVDQLIPGSKRIVLDMADLTHMDSVGLGTLVRLYVSAKAAGCVIELQNIGKSVRQLLGVTHLISVFAIVGENNIRMG